MEAQPVPQKQAKAVPMPMPDAMMDSRPENPNIYWFRGPCRCREEDGVRSPCARLLKRKDRGMSCADDLFQHLVRGGKLIGTAESYLQPTRNFEYVFRWLVGVSRHAILTLHHSSAAMRTIRMSNPMTGEYIGAIISVILAISYLLALLKILMALIKVFKVIWKALWLIWVLFRFFISVIERCISS
jgi:hypothetical protein